MSGLGKHRPAALIAAAAAALVLAACGGSSGSSSSSGGAVREGGVFRMGTSSTIDSLNPFIAFQSDAYTTFEYLYPTLVQYTPSLKIVENFARSWKTSPDGRTWTFTTQPNAKWSDGKPLTAADAAWTFSTILKFADGATANSAGYVAHMKSATAPNATTLVLSYSQPVANVLSQVQQAPILPEHIWAQYATGNGKALKTFQTNAPIVSGGPFILTKYTPKQVALFKKNPSFYGPKPHIDGFGLQFFQTTDAEVTALKSGQLDGVEVPVPPTSVATLKADHFTVRSTPGIAFDDFIINPRSSRPATPSCSTRCCGRRSTTRSTGRPWWRPRCSGTGPGSTIITATGQWSDPSSPTPFSLATASQLLDKAATRWGRTACGSPTVTRCHTVIMPSGLAGQYLSRSFQFILSDFKKIGVQLNLKVLDPSAAYDAILANNYRNFEISMWDWFPLTDPDFMLSVLTCNSFDVWNDTGYCSKAYDNLYSQQSAAVNPAQRQQVVYQMQQMIASADPYLVIDYPDSIEAQSSHWSLLPEVGGGSFNSMSTIPMVSVHRL